MAFGAIAGFLGANIASVERDLFTSIAYILLSFFLIFSAVRSHKKSQNCNISKLLKITKSGFILGILTGINFCPAFLIALSKAIDLAGIFNGIFLFLGFFIGTTLFLVPLGLINVMSKIKMMKKIARIASIAVAIWFIYTGVTNLINWKQHQIHIENSRIVDVFDPNLNVIIVYSEENKNYYKALHDSVKTKKNRVFLRKLYALSKNEVKSDTNSVYILDKSLEKENIDYILKKDYIIVEKEYPIDQLVNYLNRFVFKAEHLKSEFELDSKKKSKEN